MTHGFQTAHDQFSKLNQSDPAWLREFRIESMKRFNELGLPTIKNEDWKYTNLARVTEIPVPASKVPSVSERFVDSLALTAQEIRIVFLDGLYSHAHSKSNDSVTLSKIIESMNEREVHSLMKAHQSEPMNILNLAFLHFGFRIQVTKPSLLHILHVATKNSSSFMSQIRNKIDVEDGVQCTVVEHFVGETGNSYFANTVTEINVKNSASVEHYIVGLQGSSAIHVAHTDFNLSKKSEAATTSICLGGGLVRNETYVTFLGEGAKAELRGLYAGRANQHIDNFTVIDHKVPRCTSTELYKGILDGQSRAVFTGKITVHQNAQKTDARQVNKNLLLSNTAEVDTVPRLQIYADDVKCSHGATVGQLDESAVFYLRSRGLGIQAARNLLTHAFAREIVDEMRQPQLRSVLEAKISQWLSGAQI